MNQLAIDQTFQVALQRQQAGRLAEAEQLYRQVLAQQPDHVEALHLLGVTARQTGRLDVAAELIGKALRLQPNHRYACNNLGNVLLAQGKFDGAIACYRKAIVLQPGYAEAHNNLGNALKAGGNIGHAIAAYRQAISLKPEYAKAWSNLGNALQEANELQEAISALRRAIQLNHNLAEAHTNLGNALRQAGQLDDAITACRQAIVLNSNLAEAHLNLGNALQARGCVQEAVAAHRQAIALKPGCANCHLNLGNSLKELGLFDQAIATYRQAIRLRHDFPEAHGNLGTALIARGQYEEAIDAYRQAIALKPDYVEAYCNLGGALAHLDRLDEALAACETALELKPDLPQAACSLGVALQAAGHLDQAIQRYEQALSLEPNLADAHWNLGLALLLGGEYARGWQQYEWRWRRSDAPVPIRQFSKPQWNGQAIDGTLLVCAEQGYGDVIQFIRYVPLLAARVGKIIVECPADLRRILQTVGDLEFVEAGRTPAFDVQCQMMSLPYLLGTTLETIPASMPYLHADPAMAERWRQRLADDGTDLKVGLVWSGNSDHKNDRSRSIALSKFAPLAQATGVRFYGLQKGPPREQLQCTPAGLNIRDWTDELRDFADTAALIANLDLVISVDTSVAHLAGALGKPVWVLLPFAPDWRWMLQRRDNPWYPTACLFRQPARGDWDSVMKQVAGDLAALQAGQRELSPGCRYHLPTDEPREPTFSTGPAAPSGR